MTKKEKMRDLMCAGINELIRAEKIDINYSAIKGEDGSFMTILFDKETKISWRHMNYGEIRITIWWGVKATCIDTTTTLPLNKNKKDAFDACCSGYFERKDGKWLQGYGKDGFYDTFCARNAESDLISIAEINPLGYEKEGLYEI